MRRSVRVVLSSMLRLSWLRSLSWASCSWSSERRNASGRGSSSVSRPSSSLRTSSISCSSSPRTTWTSFSAWASLAQYSSASARVFPTCGASVKEQKTGIRLLMNNNSVHGLDLHFTYLNLIAVQQAFILLDGSFDLLELWLRQGQLFLHRRCCSLTRTHSFGWRVITYQIKRAIHPPDLISVV